MVRIQGMAKPKDESEHENGYVWRFNHEWPARLMICTGALLCTAARPEAIATDDEPLKRECGEKRCEIFQDGQKCPFFTISLAAAGVHFQMRVFTQAIDSYESSFSETDAFQRLAFLSAPIAP